MSREQASNRASQDDLGDRMKFYERAETGRHLLPLVPACVRIDGRSFSRWTKDLPRPFHEGMVRCMVETTRFLVQESNALIGYTQSDEISLVLYSEHPQSQLLFNGKLQKLASVLASAATAKFGSLVPEYIPQKAGHIAMFDARVWNVPHLGEAANMLLWRELDATRNSIQMAAGSEYSHKELHKKNTSEMQEMLFAKGINWNDYPDYFKRGTYLRRQKSTRLLTAEEREKIPAAHRPPENTEVERTDIVQLALPPLRKITNRTETLFAGAEPALA